MIQPPVAQTAQPLPESTRRFVLLLLAVSALRLAAAGAIPLSGDEAYYWTWTRHLALGYHDHPPMVAWIIALATTLFGTSTVAVRLPFVLIGGGTAWLSFLLGWRLSGRETVALWSGGLALAVPLFTLAGLGVFPDSPLLMACAGFFVCGWSASRKGSMAAWIGAGLCAGLAVSSKLTGLYLMPALLVFLLLQRRDALRTAGPYVMVAAALVASSPFLYWNLTHGFESVVYQYGNRLGASASQHKMYTPSYLLLSALAVSPVLYVMLGLAVLRAGLIGLRDRDPALGFVFCMAAPLHLVFLLVSLQTKVGLHWTAPGTLAAFPALGAWIAASDDRHENGVPRLRIAAWIGVALALCINLLVFFFTFAPVTLVGLVSGGVQMSGINHGQPVNIHEVTEVLGYPEAGAHLRESAAAAPDAFLISTNYALSSALWFYSGQPFHVIMGGRVGAQYDHWDDFGALIGRDAIYVDTSPIESREDVWEKLHEAFDEVILEPPFTSHGHGVEARTYYIARCKNFHLDVFTELQSIHRR